MSTRRTRVSRSDTLNHNAIKIMTNVVYDLATLASTMGYLKDAAKREYPDTGFEYYSDIASKKTVKLYHEACLLAKRLDDLLAQ